MGSFFKKQTRSEFKQVLEKGATIDVEDLGNMNQEMREEYEQILANQSKTLDFQNRAKQLQIRFMKKK